jgi:hypothetical protein
MPSQGSTKVEEGIEGRLWAKVEDFRRKNKPTMPARARHKGLLSFQPDLSINVLGIDEPK